MPHLGVLALVAILGAPLADAEIRLSDPAGDQEFSMGEEPAPDVAGIYAEADMLEFAVTETERTVVFRLETAVIPEDRNFQAEVTFTFGTVEHRLILDDKVASTARLWGDGPGADLEISYDGNARIVEIPKNQLIDDTGTAGATGTGLTVLRVETEATPAIGVGRDIIEEEASMVLELGGSPAKDVRIGSPAPTRVSNGAATVYAYTLTILNLLDEDATMSLDHREVPNQWEVLFPVDVVALGANELRKVPVLVSVPFAHEHGSYQSVWIEARHVGESEVLSDAELGIRYTPIPQPAGHHQDVWFHSAERDRSPNPDGVLYFNTLEEDERDEDIAGMPKCYSSSEEAHVDYTWTTRMDRPMWLGLDFDVNKTIDAIIPINAPRDMPDLEMNATFLIRGNLLAGISDQPISLVSGLNEVQVPLPIYPLGDKFPPITDGILEFIVRIDSPLDPVGPGCNFVSPTWMPGGSMHLPLYEYHDPLPLDLGQVLTAQDAPDAVQPGSRLVIQHSIAGAPDSKFALSLFGHGSEFAAVRPGFVKTDTQGHASFDLVIDIPADEADGRAFDIIVEASNGHAVGLHRTAFVVSSQGETRQDTGGDTASERNAPSLPVILLAAALALSAVRRKRNP